MPDTRHSWLVERQGVKTDKDRGIVNDANDANELARRNHGQPALPSERFQRLVTVSLETMKIVGRVRVRVLRRRAPE